MNQDVLFNSIDAFVDSDGEFTEGMENYLGKPIYKSDDFVIENKNEIFIFIGSVIYYSELKLRLLKLGFKEDEDFRWALGFPGDSKCKAFWHDLEWNDTSKNSNAIDNVVSGKFWLDRMKLIAELLDDKTKCVVDLCGANGRMQTFLKEDIDYFAVDYMKYTEDTILCNLDKYEYPDIKYKANDVTVVLLASIQYIEDWRWLLKKVSESCDTFICAHSEIGRISRDYRREHYCWKNALFSYDIILEMQKNGFKLIEAYDYRMRNSIMKFVKVK